MELCHGRLVRGASWSCPWHAFAEDLHQLLGLKIDGLPLGSRSFLNPALGRGPGPRTQRVAWSLPGGLQFLSGNLDPKMVLGRRHGGVRKDMVRVE